MMQMKPEEKLFSEQRVYELLECSHEESRTVAYRIGWLSVATLVAAAVAILAVAGFLAFLWFAGFDNTLWHRIMVHDWATRATSISTLVLRVAIDLSAGITASMLAAVVLESSWARLHAVAKISIMRATTPQPRQLLDLVPAILGPNWAMAGVRSVALSLATVLLVLTTMALQFSSTLLLSDIRLGQLPGIPSQRFVAYDFVYPKYQQMQEFGPGVALGAMGSGSYPIQLRTPTWSRNPPAYPAFAEYSRPLPQVGAVDDTGVLLRAFLPFADANSRESVRNYSGDAMVLDARVSCWIVQRRCMV